MRNIWIGAIAAILVPFTVRLKTFCQRKSPLPMRRACRRCSLPRPRRTSLEWSRPCTLPWVSVAPNGEKTSRDQAEKQLLGLLSIPPGQRPTPLQKIVYVSEPGPRVLVVYWVYRTHRRRTRGIDGSRHMDADSGRDGVAQRTKNCFPTAHSSCRNPNHKQRRHCSIPDDRLRQRTPRLRRFSADPPIQIELNRLALHPFGPPNAPPH